MNKYLLYPAFALMVLAQLYVPARMIFHNEVVLVSGTAFKFKAAPVDPNDPFRGKYITLTFDENAYSIPDSVDWAQGESIFVNLTMDTAGYAKILNVSKTEPVDREDYVKATVNYSVWDTVTTVYIEYPFDQYYMEESKAPDAANVYNEAARDTNQVTYALVLVKKGQAVIKDVMIGDSSIVDIVHYRNSK